MIAHITTDHLNENKTTKLVNEWLTDISRCIIRVRTVTDNFATPFSDLPLQVQWLVILNAAEMNAQRGNLRTLGLGSGGNAVIGDLNPVAMAYFDDVFYHAQRILVEDETLDLRLSAAWEASAAWSKSTSSTVKLAKMIAERDKKREAAAAQAEQAHKPRAQQDTPPASDQAA